MRRYDLHTHSDRSDGALPPSEVVRRAAAAGLDGIALTDHDSTSGLDEAAAEGARLGVEVLPGCEVSAGWRGAPVHVLAYFVDLDNPRWVEELRSLRDDRVARAEQMVEKLIGLGVSITFHQVRAIAKGESVGRPHVAQAMVDAGVIARTPDAFTGEWIGDNGRAYVPKRSLSPQKSVQMIVEAGGVAALAHPIWIERDVGGVEALIEECVGQGMGALEVNHPDHDLAWRDHFGRIADDLGLVPTSSSDFHGNQHGGTLGQNVAGEDVVSALRARARTRS